MEPAAILASHPQSTSQVTTGTTVFTATQTTDTTDPDAVITAAVRLTWGEVLLPSVIKHSTGQRQDAERPYAASQGGSA